MANITNRSPWIANAHRKGEPPREFRLKSKALEYLATFGHTDPAALTRKHLKQLETAFEVQIKLKDKAGEIVKRSSTFSTAQEAQTWAEAQETEIKSYRERHGGFVADFETMTVEEALTKFHSQHYTDKRSAKEVGYRIRHLADWLGASRPFRTLNRKDFIKLRDDMEGMEYSASSMRNYFTILTSLYQHAANDWLYPVDNHARGIKLPKPANHKQRFWMADEERRLMESIRKNFAWLEPIVRLSLAMAFRRGEIIQGAKDSKTGLQSGGLRWEDIDWDKKQVTLPREKNDHTKAVTEEAGRKVPLTTEIEAILRPLFDASTSKRGLIFSTTTNTVSKAFRQACERAEPPIEQLTFHSLRKIATKRLSELVTNPMELSRLTGHKSIDVLNRRYFQVSTDELRSKLEINSAELLQKGVSALSSALGGERARKFLELVRSMPNVEDAFKPSTNTEQAA